MQLPKKKSAMVNNAPYSGGIEMVLDSKGIALTAKIIRNIFKGNKSLMEVKMPIVISYKKWLKVLELCNYLEKKQ